MPSHDESHHLRTWYFARDLIMALIKDGAQFSPDIIEAVLIAVLLHDTGMSITTDVTHGTASRKLTGQFFSGISGTPVLKEEILQAIERHDNKDYTKEAVTGNNTGVILFILSLADDMDAFGTIGVFRYYEIYTLRGIHTEDLPEKIIPNLDNRFMTMSVRLKNLSRFLSVQKKRYLQTRKFYEDLSGSSSTSDLEGAEKVIRYFEEEIRMPRNKPEEIIPSLLPGISKNYPLFFFTEFKKELSSFPDYPFHKP